MNDRQFRYFIAVADELSFSRAAKRLNVSQPPLSKQIMALEDELGAPLFARNKRHVELTQAGAIFLERARFAMKEMDEAAEMVRRASRGEAGALRIGFVSSVPMLDAFAELLRNFRAAYPKVRVELQHVTSGLQFQALAEQRLDVGFLRPPYRFQGGLDIETFDFWHDRLIVFIPEGHPLAMQKGELRVRDLAEAPFVAVGSRAGCGVRDHIVTMCGAAGFRPNIVQEGNELGTLLGLVAAGIGISILPECFGRADVKGVVQRPLAATDEKSRVLLALRASCDDPIIKNFLRIAESLGAKPSSAHFPRAA